MREIAALNELDAAIKFMNCSGHGARHPRRGKEREQFEHQKSYGDDPQRLAPDFSRFARSEKLLLRQRRCPVEDKAFVLFALARTTGWVAHWNEMISDPEQKIGRPRQLYTGPAQRDYVPCDRR